jgi:transposase-like protein
MLKPEDSQKIEDYIKMIEALDVEDRQEAINETNDKLEKVEGVQSAPLRIPNCRIRLTQKPKAKGSDLFCPHCGSHSISKNGSVRGSARLICKDCKKSFGSNYGKVTYQSNHCETKWDKYLEGMVCSDTLLQLSEKCEISLSTAHNWRMKVFRMIMQSKEALSLKGIVQEDEWYLSASFKGNKNALLNLKEREIGADDEISTDYQKYGFSGHPRLRGGQDTKRGLSKEKICIPTAIDSTGGCIGRPMGRGNVQIDFLEVFFKDHLDEDVVLVTDKSKSGKSYAKKNKISHVALDSKKESRSGEYNLQTINNFHSMLSGIAHSKRSFATKYCEEYLYWISWQAKMSGGTVQEKVSALKVMAPARGKTVLIKDILKKEFPVELRK